MTRKTPGVLAIALLAALAAPAMAHPTLEVAQAEIGSTYKGVVRIPHGCSGQATHTVRVRIPEGFVNAKPQPKPGWTLDIARGPFDRPYDNYGTTVTEGVREIVWSGGHLPTEWFDEFVFRGNLAPELAPGDLYFPVVQECANGVEEWTDISGREDASHPAPRLRLLPAAGHAHAH